MKTIKFIVISILSITALISCGSEDLEPTLGQDKAVETSINTEGDLSGLLLGVYNQLTLPELYGRDIIIFGECRTDNTFSNGYSGRFLTIGRMEMEPTDAYARTLWRESYEAIASANVIINADVNSITGDINTINHIKGEAYALRALLHFELLKHFGQEHAGGNLGIPYVMKYKADNLYPARNTVAEVKSFIGDDLEMASSLMDVSLNNSNKVQITTYAVEALKSRFYLYIKDWGKVITASQNIINSGNFTIADGATLAANFGTSNAPNSIFELAFSDAEKTGSDALGQIYRGNVYGDIQVIDQFVSIFDVNDSRIAPSMFGLEGSKYRNLGKYQSAEGTDNIVLFRYEEVILNYAEALFENSGANALTYLNMIPEKRNLGANYYSVITKDNILLERRKELAFEGFRFWDLARTGKGIPNINPLQQTIPAAGVAYGSSIFAFPIPSNEINANSNIVQNEGYGQ